MTSRETVEFAMGFHYMFFTLSLSLYYLTLLAPSTTNDLWWANFNTSGAQSYLINIFNSELNSADNERTTLELTAKVHGLGRDYSHLNTPIAPRLCIHGLFLMRSAKTSQRLFVVC
ncbi:hypothetical protein AC1031_014097 [Aphanomyces cochlioides]|nr:hypothetical protein AC1031_014097 [Aphanomyces cochlioides]